MTAMFDKKFTTTQVADMMGVHPGTVARWVNLVQLRAHVTPGGHRRITMADLFEFFKKHDVQIPDNLAHHGKLKVLIVEDNKAVLDVLAAGLRAQKKKYRVLSEHHLPCRNRKGQNPGIQHRQSSTVRIRHALSGQGRHSPHDRPAHVRPFQGNLYARG